ncbi:hypothetical protein M378DRAFT_174331 [Amanita muscaria Koide BX008]|uniref:Uncharacterized protein n=1 Tax=Amanita muscaria (strain Koide BX008) TaxID=946122 RepID=A0A0C2SK07_AMAMK|nr:hypothetical protein M378DRAFT_174331 [Amanita muscaria Koide BX008]
MNSYPPPNTSTTSSFSREETVPPRWSVFASPNNVPPQTINVVRNQKPPPENPTISSSLHLP